MAENHIASDDAFAPEAATDEPASSIHTVNPAEDDWLEFASDAEEDAYWKGMAQGIRSAGREPAHLHMPDDFSLDLKRDSAAGALVSARPLAADALDEDLIRRGTGRGTAARSGVVEGSAAVQPTPAASAPPPASPVPLPVPGRIEEGFTPAKRHLFLQVLAACGVVADACRMAGISRPTAYNLRNSAEGAAFALAWNAARQIARGRMSDELMSRAMCGCIERVYRNGELVAERHRYDNRLSMAVLTRLDREAEGLGEGAATARTVAQEWDQFLDVVEAGEGAEEFLRGRLKPPHTGADLEAGATRLARLDLYRRHGAGLPHEIDTAALDPAGMSGWTDAEWARAQASGMLDRLAPDQWPAEARATGDTSADGMCKARKAYLDRHRRSRRASTISAAARVGKTKANGSPTSPRRPASAAGKKATPTRTTITSANSRPPSLSRCAPSWTRSPARRRPTGWRCTPRATAISASWRSLKTRRRPHREIPQARNNPT